MTSTKTALTSAYDSMKSTTQTSSASIQKTAVNAFSAISKGASTYMTSAKNAIANQLASAKTSMATATAGMKSNAATQFAGIYSTINSKVASVKSSVQTGFTSVKNTMTNLISSAKTAMGKISFYSIGSNICSGIANGINNNWSWLVQKVKNLASNMLSAAKSVLGIHSPSRLFRDEVGMNIGLGMAEGIEDSEDAVVDSVTGIADAIAAEAKAGDYTLNNLIPTAEIDGTLTTFSDKITDGFSALLDRLQAIADGVTFTVPAAASGVIPYQVAANAESGSNDVGRMIEASNDELSSVVIQSVSNAASAIVSAIQQYSGGPTIDGRYIADMTIKEINRRAMATGQSPILGL